MLSNRITPTLNRLKTLKPLALLITALLGAFLFIYLFGSATYDLEGLSLSISAKPSATSKTIIELPPFGSVSASTHDIPIEFVIKLDYIGTALASSFFTNDGESSDTIIDDLKLSLPNIIRPFLLKQIILGALGAALGVWLLWRSRFTTVMGAAVLGGLLIALILGLSMQNYDIQAFKEPEYSGVLAMAPNIIPEPDRLLERLEMIQYHTRKAAGNIQSLFANVNSLSVLANPEEDTEIKKILLISDLHSNPIGVEFIKGLAQNFQVAAIIDMGDLTDFGNPLETKMTEGLLNIDLPYVFVPGNHDTPETISFVKEMKNSIVLEGKTISIEGIKIKGNADPLATSSEVFIEDRQEWEAMLNQQVEDLLPNQDEDGNEPDIVVVHNHEVAQKLNKYYPLVINGHTHQQNIITNPDKIRINPGTAGAAGVRGLYSDTSIPYSAVILYIKPGEKPVAADQIKYDPFSDRFFLERKMFKNGTSIQIAPGN